MQKAFLVVRTKLYTIRGLGLDYDSSRLLI